MSDTITPMMAQYLEIKAQHSDALLFYRMGDFYELFFDDAIAAAAALDIALTKRGKHLGKDIAMCGVPQHAAESYLLTLIRKGFRVTIAEQMESPAEAKKRGSKSVVKREVVRLVTPGTLTEETLLDARRNNFLAAFAEVRDEAALAWLDVSTGAFTVAPCPAPMLSPILARITPSEVLVREGSEQPLRETVEEAGATLTALATSSFDSTGAETRLNAVFSTKSLEGFGTFTRPELSAMGALLDYIEITQKGRVPLIRPPQRETMGGSVQIDAATRRNLELTHALSGGRAGSLLNAIDRSITGAGARLLETRLCAPSTDLDLIIRRQSALQTFLKDHMIRRNTRDALRLVPDIERALNRLALDRGGPRDLAAIRNGLSAASSTAGLLDGIEPLAHARDALLGHDALITLLQNALIAEPPLLTRDGSFVATSYNKPLDEARTLRDEGRSVIASMQAEYQQLTGINSLKIKHNNVLGYFIETTATHAETMRSERFADTFIHRQTTANQVRFTTLALSDMETKILNAGGAARAAELEIFADLRADVLARSAPIGAAARALAEIDVTAALAELAAEQDWCRPKLDQSRAFKITAGRHPVVEDALRRTGQSFIANDCALTQDDARIWLLTGPNMAGKSTFLRQNAIIALLAQTGAWVPAESAHIGLVNQVFSRVGAADDLARGRSTFMVEMVETAAILNQAGDRALVILDEIGRGTATYDGLSIAWATLEHLHDSNRCRALFATHYHELTALTERLDALRNATVAVREHKGDVIFLHEVRPGAADRSYGIQVGRLAGLPPAVVARAREVLDVLEAGDREDGAKTKALIDDLPLFSTASQPSVKPQEISPSKLETHLTDISPDALTPREALDLVYELKALLKD